MAKHRQLASERRKMILRHLRAEGSASVSDLCQVVGSSLATVHRDLEKLAREGEITRVRGGALAREDVDDPPVSGERTKHVAEKRAIAELAADLVGDDVTSIFLEASTTVHQLLPRLSELRDKVFVTNSPEIGLELAESNNDVILIGGELRARTLASVGQLAIQALESVVIDLAFLGVSAIDAEGLSSMNLNEAETKSAILRRASRCVAIGDGTKLGRRALAPVGSLDAIDVLVTDGSADRDEVAKLRAAGLEVLVAEH